MTNARTFNPDSPEGREILARQEASMQRWKEESDPRHEAAVAIWGIDAAAKKAGENDKTLMVNNPWTGQAQSYQEFAADRQTRLPEQYSAAPEETGATIHQIGEAATAGANQPPPINDEQVA